MLAPPPGASIYGPGGAAAGGGDGGFGPAAKRHRRQPQAHGGAGYGGAAVPLMSIDAPASAVSAALAAAQRGHAARAAQQHHQQQQAAHFAAQRQQQQSAMLSAAAAQIPPRPEMLFRPEPVREEETAELERMGVPVMVACQRLMTDPALFELVDALRAVTVLRRRQIEAAWAALRREHGARLAALDARAGGAPGVQLEVRGALPRSRALAV